MQFYRKILFTEFLFKGGFPVSIFPENTPVALESDLILPGKMNRSFQGFNRQTFMLPKEVNLEPGVT